MSRRRALRSGRLSIVIVSVLLITGATTVLAEADIGIYFDTAYTERTAEVTEYPSFVDAYIVLKNPDTELGVIAWECEVGVTGGGLGVLWATEGLAVNVLTPPEFQVGLGGDPLADTPDGVLLASFQVYVQSAEPITLTLEPLLRASIDDHMAYLPAEEGADLLPMFPSTGSAEVAWINAHLPLPVVSPLAIDFDTIPLGQQRQGAVTVRNAGGGIVSVDAALEAGCTDFTITGGAGPHDLGPDQRVTIDILFEPLALGPSGCLLELGPGIDPVPLTGGAREPVASWIVTPAVDFGEVLIGDSRGEGVNIFNTGETYLELVPALSEPFPDITIEDLGDGGPVGPGEHRLLLLVYRPTAPSELSLFLELGPVLPDVPLTGSSREPITSWQILPDELQFGSVPPFFVHSRGILFLNDGESDLTLEPVFTDPDQGFFGIGYPSSVLVQPGQSHQFTVNFRSDVEGDYHTTLELGAMLPTVPLYATVDNASGDCIVSDPSLDFGIIEPGTSLELPLLVTNGGDQFLNLNPYTQGLYFYYVTTGAPSLQPGESTTLILRFTPEEPGHFQGTLHIGPPECPPVLLMGTGRGATAGGDDLIGLYFDADVYQENEYHAYNGPGERISAYLVLSDVSHLSGVSAWECRFDILGDVVNLGWQLEGSTVNVGTDGELIVGLASPLAPGAPQILLGTVDLVSNLDIYDSALLTLNPIRQPTLDGEMAWVAAGDPQTLRPMTPATGEMVVAVITGDSPLAIDLPAPALSVAAGRVRLQWSPNVAFPEGCHVYRRGPTGETVRLTERPIMPTGRDFVFEDMPYGFDEGAIVRYSYTRIEGGVEVRFSPEAEFALSSLPSIGTRLRPNVPNPFNPSTEVHFEVDRRQRVRVAIFDLNGRLVRVLADTELAPGPHMKVWDGRDRQGRQVPSGAYYLRLESETRVDHSKMMLLK